jgi:hypothetical protein
MPIISSRYYKLIICFMADIGGCEKLCVNAKREMSQPIPA